MFPDQWLLPDDWPFPFTDPETRDDQATARKLSGTFKVDDAAYRRGYDELHSVYEDVVAAKKWVLARAESLQPAQVAPRISGVRTGSFAAKLAVARDGPGDKALVAALLGLEAMLAETLIKMHDAYVKYVETDDAASFTFKRAAGS